MTTSQSLLLPDRADYTASCLLPPWPDEEPCSQGTPWPCIPPPPRAGSAPQQPRPPQPLHEPCVLQRRERPDRASPAGESPAPDAPSCAWVQPAARPGSGKGVLRNTVPHTALQQRGKGKERLSADGRAPNFSAERRAAKGISRQG